MGGSVYLTALVTVILILIVALGGLSVIFLVPIFTIALLVVFAGPVLRFISDRGSPGSGDPTGVPSTSDASYEPVREPGDQS